MNMDSKTSGYNKFLSAAFCLGILAYLVSIIWFNFHGKAFYIFDVYSDALVAKYMAEEGSLFPSNWVFGNQYYIAATPALAALIYIFCQNSVLSLTVASCIMTVLIIVSFVWCCKPFAKRDSILVGLFCLIGAVILGNGICTYKEGLQFLYTMASFYACYVICFLFTIGAYYRLKNGIKLSVPIYIAVIALNVAMGMQSLRQLLILNIPLILVEALSLFTGYIRKRQIHNKKTLAFVIIMFIAELFGILLISFFEINADPLISPISLVRTFSDFLYKLKFALDNLMAISGLVFLRQGIQWMPLGLIGLFVIGVIAFAVIRIIVKKDLSVPAQFLLFSLLSVACVFGVGITVFVAESRYFFIRHVAAAFAFMYLAEKMPDNFWKKAGLTALLFCGAVNLFYNVYPDYKKAETLEEFYEYIGEDLLAQGIDCVLIDRFTHPSVAACSDDEISCLTFYPNFSNYQETGSIFVSVKYLRPIDVVENLDPAKTVVMINEYPDVYMYSFLTELAEAAPVDYMELYNEQLTPLKTYEHELVDVHVYTFDNADIIS